MTSQNKVILPNPIGTSIRLFLVDGTPDGLWVVEKSNWTGLALIASRLHYSILRLRPEMCGPGVYVLVGPPQGSVKPSRIYVGETDDLKERLDHHYQNKDFWTRVIIFTAKDDNLNKAHVRYLESRLHAIAANSNRAEIENNSVTTLPTLSEADRADMESFLADMLLIYPVVGVNAFEMTLQESLANPINHLRLTGSGAEAEGNETSDGFVVYAGALARRESVPSIHAYGQELRNSLVAAGVFIPDGEHLRLTQDYVFSSPSTAAMVLQGRTANGRIEWKLSDGTTLKEVQDLAIGFSGNQE